MQGQKGYDFKDTVVKQELEKIYRERVIHSPFNLSSEFVKFLSSLSWIGDSFKKHYA